jgi:hypothetical protein
MPTMPFAAPVDAPPPPAPPTIPWSPVGAVLPEEPQPRTTPPTWDPLGAAPFAWDLPEPATPEPEEPAPPKRRKPRVGTATLGIALVVAAAMAIVGNATWGRGGWLSPQHIFGVVLAIVGLGLVAGAFLRAGRGLIALAVPLSVVGMGLTTISPHGYQGVGDLSANPVSTAAVRPVYERSVGSITLDLAALPKTGQVDTDVRTGAGSVTVLVPTNADVVVSCSAGAGSVTCLGQERNGIDSRVVRYTDLGPDGEGGLKINLVVRADIGDVEVRRV